MKLKLIFCIIVFGLFISACTLFVKPECSSENDCLEIACPGGTFAHEMCVEGKCTLSQGCPNCAAEGEYNSGPVSPENYLGCCEGLQGFDMTPGLLGATQLCYDPAKGTPECGAVGTRSEGWYYSNTGALLTYSQCEVPVQETPSQRFCGWATNASCTYTSDCMAGGCSGQVCGGKNEELITTCEYTDCYNAAKYNASCACVMGKCNWVIKASS